MTNDPLTLTESNVSTAWTKAFLAAHASGVDTLSPLVVTVNLGADTTAPEIAGIRDVLDACNKTLKARHANLQQVSAVAGTIFPESFWNPHHADGPELLFRRFEKAWPRIRKCRQNQRGSYFHRMIAYRPEKPGEKPVNQLKHIVETYRKGNHRRSAFQAAIFDPALDHNDARQLGFPCLHQVSFAPTGADGLAITAYYAMQYVFDRAYGNYLGLCRLGTFIASQLDRRLVRMTCIAATAELGSPSKSELAGLAAALRILVAETQGAAA